MRNVEDIYPLSPMQQGMLFHTLYAPKSGVYFEQWSCLLRGELDVKAFRRAWHEVVDRHSILRTAFLWEGLDEPLQVVREQVELPWEEQDWRGIPRAELERRVRELHQARRQRGFDLSRAPLMQIELVRTGEREHHLTWEFHHILLDGWSMSLVFNEVYRFYESFSRGEQLTLPRSRPYRDYIAWLQRQDLSRAEAFWRQLLKGFARPNVLRVGRAAGSLPSQGEDYFRRRIQLPEALTAALGAFARQHQVTLSTVVQGAWALLVSRYSGDEDVVFGSTTSGRPPELAGVESMVGLFVNNLPVRVQVSTGASLLPWLRELQNQRAEARQYEYTPLVRVQGWSEVSRGVSLFETLQVFENYPRNAAWKQGGDIEVDSIRSFEKTSFPMTFMSSTGLRLPLELWCDARRFEPSTVDGMLGHLRRFLEGFVASSERRLIDFELLTREERQDVVDSFNADLR